MSIESMKVLLVEDNPGDARLLQEGLADSPATHLQLTHVQRLGDAVSALSSNHFDVVLLDLSLPDSQGFETFRRLRLRSNGVPVIVLSGVDDEQLALKAVQKGAQDYLVKGQVATSSLVRSIRHAIERDKRLAAQLGGWRKPGKVIAFVGAKGGVGTTTVALNVAAVLAREQKQVIAVELRDYPGSFSLQMDRKPFEDLGGLLKLPADQIDTGQVARCLTDSSHGFRILFGPQHVPIPAPITPGQVDAILTELARLGEYVVLDLPVHPAPANQAALRRASFVALTVGRDLASTALGGLAVELFESWGVSKERVGAVVVHQGVYESNFKLAELRERVRCQIVSIVQPDAHACALAEKLGVPVVLSQPHELAAVAMSKLADQIAAGELNPVGLS
jgi:DNA-binding response OmpR family regulator